MENNELFQTIEQLKETLSEVATAREQVSETVKAYGQTQIQIHSYIDNLNQIEAAISSLMTLLQKNKVVVDQQSNTAINSLKTSCDTILDHVKNEFATTSQRFSDDTGKNLRTMSAQIEKLDHSVDKANTLTNKVEAISKEVSDLINSVKILQVSLVDSQRTQDDAIEIISNKQDDTKVSLSKQDEILERHTNALESLMTNVSENRDSIRQDLVMLSSAIAASTDSLNKAIEELNTSLNSASAETIKGIKINRWLIIAVFIILAILQYLFK